jgi:hypothetical protein
MIAITTERLRASRRMRRDIAQRRELIDARTLAEIRRESLTKAKPEAGGSSWIGRILSKLSGST